MAQEQWIGDPTAIGPHTGVHGIGTILSICYAWSLTQPAFGADHPGKRENRPPTADELCQLFRSSVQVWVWNCRRRDPARSTAVLAAGLVANCPAVSSAGDTVAVGCNERAPQEGQGAPVLTGLVSASGNIEFHPVGTQAYDVRAVAFTADGPRVIS
jgi:hypothetical protein